MAQKVKKDVCLSPNATRAGARVTKLPVPLPTFGLSILPSHCQSTSATMLQPERHGDGTGQLEKLDDAHQGRKEGQGAGRVVAARGL